MPGGVQDDGGDEAVEEATGIHPGLRGCGTRLQRFRTNSQSIRRRESPFAFTPVCRVHLTGFY